MTRNYTQRRNIFFFTTKTKLSNADKSLGSTDNHNTGDL